MRQTVRVSMVQGGKFGSDTNFTTQDIKQEIVAEYIDTHGAHETDQEIADVLGVSEQWVRGVRMSMIENDKIRGSADFITQEIKHELVTEYIEEHPGRIGSVGRGKHAREPADRRISYQQSESRSDRECW